MGLSDKQQGIFMFLAFVLPPVELWFACGMPATPAAVGGLGAAVVAGIIAYIKESLGGAQSTATATISGTAHT